MEKEMTMKDIHDALVRAGRLETRPIGVYGAQTPPPGAVSVASVIPSGHRCLAKALLKMALDPRVPPIVIGKDYLKGVCQAAPSFLGFRDFPPSFKTYLSTGGKGEGGEEEEGVYLKATPEICEATLGKIGKIAPPASNLVMQACGDIKEAPAAVRSVLCFGNAEQIRNLAGLIHFGKSDPFGFVMSPWGSHCSLFVTYPSGMAGNAPPDTAFIGPTAPDGNSWFPPGLLSLSMPLSMAAEMAGNIERSFVGKLPGMAYPEERENIFS